MSALELVAVAVTLAAVYLTTRQVIWCWPLSMASVCMYALIFRDARLYADMGLQGLYFGLAAYGWWAWLHGGTDHGELEVSLASNRLRATACALALVGGTLLGGVLGRFTDASLPYLDSLLTAFSIAAQWMQTRKLLENWIVWLGVDVLYVGMFLYKGLYPTAALYAVFLLLAALGFVKWRRSMGRPAAGARPAVPEAAG
ncbi:MAG: nicotinamide riboside transporter PnuC [Acidobacteriota bacterium]|nr:nicotinamide riboside transporter PnuC [Acidobacteriota bacterium]